MIAQSFFHPQYGIWHTGGEVSAEDMKKFPDGTIQIPLPPTIHHKWDGSRWIAPTTAETKERIGNEARAKRQHILESEVDPVINNTLRFTEMTPQKRESWIAYRKALLDITNQSGFPEVIAWPSKPE